jgi:proton-coupled amino acid transporter
MVTLNLPHDNVTSLIQIFYCFGLLGSYPMQAFPVFEIIERSARYKNWRNCFKCRLGWTKTYLVRTLSVLFTFIIAVSVPKFGLFVNLLGAMSGTVLAFVMPTMIYNKVYKDEISRVRQFIHFVLVVFGVIVGTMASAISLFELIKAFGEQPDT